VISRPIETTERREKMRGLMSLAGSMLGPQPPTPAGPKIFYAVLAALLLVWLVR
jgi:hypothetical protein